MEKLFKIKNKYSLIYEKLIKSRKDLKRKCYLEKHHVIPKSLGGKDVVENLIYLTAKEHYIAHLLLFKYFKSVNHKDGLFKMSNAFMLMSGGNEFQDRYKISSIFYEKTKLEISKKRKNMVLAKNMETNETELISKELFDSQKNKKYVGNTKGYKTSQKQKEISSLKSKNTVPVYDKKEKITKRIPKELLDNKRYITLHKGKFTVLEIKSKKHIMISIEE